MAKSKKRPTLRKSRQAKHQVLAEVNVTLEQAIALHRQGLLGQAELLYAKILQIQPEHYDALYLSGVIALQRNDNHAAIGLIGKAIAVNPTQADAHSNMGTALGKLKRFEEALACFDRALQLEPGYVDAHCNRGNVLREINRQEEALTSFDNALHLSPGYAPALFNRGNALLDLRRYEDAVTTLGRLQEVSPDYNYLIGNLVYARQQCCDWTQFDIHTRKIISPVSDGRRGCTPFVSLSISPSALAQLQCARTYVSEKYPSSVTPLWSGQRYRHDKIRVAYMSADFADHAVSLLMAGLFEKHDRERFETIAFSLRPEHSGILGQRVRVAFDHFFEVSSRSDYEVAAMMREQEIDIAIDLMGHTMGGRTSIFSHRPAPIQVNFLGYPATMGAEFIDYIIADDFVIPLDKQAYYSEKVVYLPDCFQPNDDKREIIRITPTREELGFPLNGFIFCSFNNSYKINPAIFDAWMRLLKAVPGSVLWLVAGNLSVQRNLHREAAIRGIDPGRIIFAPKVKYADHLARLPLADLVLDTLPYNAGATASDALWVGVPLLTCAGEAFVSRMAGSLLRAIGIPELITHNLEGYEALAIKLATTPALLADIRTRLSQNRATSPLFDTDCYRRNIESAYIAMWERFQQGEPPASFSVQPGR